MNKGFGEVGAAAKNPLERSGGSGGAELVGRQGRGDSGGDRWQCEPFVALPRHGEVTVTAKTPSPIR